MAFRRQRDDWDKFVREHMDELDPRTRATILQLPPRVREELLQGMKAQGPEGYQKFIQDYFRRLSAVPK